MKKVTVEGEAYELPTGFNYVTRDRAGAQVFGWEKEPTWQGGYGYWHDTGYGGTAGRYVQLRPYVEQLPAGNFFLAL